VERLQLPEHRQHQHGLRQEADGEGERAQHRNAERVDDDVREARQKYTAQAMAVLSVAWPRLSRIITSAAKITRFSTALVCAKYSRCAQADCGLSSRDGLAMAPINPRTMMRSRM